MTILYIFYIFWLCAVLAFLFLIWWSTTRYIRKMENTMIQSRAISAEAALKSAEAAAKLAAMLEKEHHA
jgi:hypothetical protein